MAASNGNVSAWENTIRSTIIPMVLSLLCVGVIWAGIELRSSVDSLAEKVEQVNARQDQRLDRHDTRIRYLERYNPSWQSRNNGDDDDSSSPYAR